MSRRGGTFTTGLGPCLSLTQSLNWVDAAGGPVTLLAIVFVAVVGVGQVAYCTWTALGICTATAAPSSDCGTTRSGWPASVKMACNRERSTVRLIACAPETSSFGRPFRLPISFPGESPDCLAAG